MRSTTSLAIPQPCSKSWDAMSPTTTGRHCAACTKTVVDFTLKTDAEILAYLAGAAIGRTCGRFAAGQLERPLQRAAPAAPSGRWRAWLAAAVAVWAVREGISTEANAQAPTEWQARYGGGPVPVGPGHEGAGPATPAASVALGAAVDAATAGTIVGAKVTSVVIRGVVLDAATHLGLPGATVLLKNTQIGVSADYDGAFALTVPAQYLTAGRAEIQLSYIGYESQPHVVAVGTQASANQFYLHEDNRMLMGDMVVTTYSRKLPPAPWHPRAFYHWGKYWLTRPFRSH